MRRAYLHTVYCYVFGTLKLMPLAVGKLHYVSEIDYLCKPVAQYGVASAPVVVNPNRSHVYVLFLHRPAISLMYITVAGLPHQYGVVVMSIYPQMVLIFNEMYAPLRYSGIFVLGEAIWIFALERLKHIWFAIYMAVLVLEIVEGTQVVKSSSVVFVVVCQQYGINVPDLFTQHLMAEIRACVNHRPDSAHVHHGGCAAAFVTRICTHANGAVAGYHRHSL